MDELERAPGGVDVVYRGLIERAEPLFAHPVVREWAALAPSLGESQSAKAADLWMRELNEVIPDEPIVAWVGQSQPFGASLALALEGGTATETHVEHYGAITLAEFVDAVRKAPQTAQTIVDSGESPEYPRILAAALLLGITPTRLHGSATPRLVDLLLALKQWKLLDTTNVKGNPTFAQLTRWANVTQPEARIAIAKHVPAAAPLVQQWGFPIPDALIPFAEWPFCLRSPQIVDSAFVGRVYADAIAPTDAGFVNELALSPAAVPTLDGEYKDVRNRAGKTLRLYATDPFPLATALAQWLDPTLCARVALTVLKSNRVLALALLSRATKFPSVIRIEVFDDDDVRNALATAGFPSMYVPQPHRESFVAAQRAIRAADASAVLSMEDAPAAVSVTSRNTWFLDWPPGEVPYALAQWRGVFEGIDNPGDVTAIPQPTRCEILAQLLLDHFLRRQPVTNAPPGLPPDFPPMECFSDALQRDERTEAIDRMLKSLPDLTVLDQSDEFPVLDMAVFSVLRLAIPGRVCDRTRIRSSVLLKCWDDYSGSAVASVLDALWPRTFASAVQFEGPSAAVDTLSDKMAAARAIVADGGQLARFPHSVHRVLFQRLNIHKKIAGNAKALFKDATISITGQQVRDFRTPPPQPHDDGPFDLQDTLNLIEHPPNADERSWWGTAHRRRVDHRLRHTYWHRQGYLPARGTLEWCARSPHSASALLSTDLTLNDLPVIPALERAWPRATPFTETEESLLADQTPSTVEAALQFACLHAKHRDDPDWRLFGVLSEADADPPRIGVRVRGDTDLRVRFPFRTDVVQLDAQLLADLGIRIQGNVSLPAKSSDWTALVHRAPYLDEALWPDVWRRFEWPTDPNVQQVLASVAAVRNAFPERFGPRALVPALHSGDVEFAKRLMADHPHQHWTSHESWLAGEHGFDLPGVRSDLEGHFRFLAGLAPVDLGRLPEAPESAETVSDWANSICVPLQDPNTVPTICIQQWKPVAAFEALVTALLRLPHLSVDQLKIYVSAMHSCPEFQRFRRSWSLLVPDRPGLGRDILVKLLA